MLKNTVAVNIGRLLEVRAEAGYRTIEDVDATFGSIEEAAAKFPADIQLVTIVDWRKCSIMSPEAAARSVQRTIGIQHRTLRTAIVVSPDAPGVILQFGRVIRDADKPSRRLYSDAAQAITWLNDVLTLEERARLRWFLERA